jgi:hypothetical protein
MDNVIVFLHVTFIKISLMLQTDIEFEHRTAINP